jgi:hypothetical protein
MQRDRTVRGLTTIHQMEYTTGLTDIMWLIGKRRYVLQVQGTGTLSAMTTLAQLTDLADYGSIYRQPCRLLTVAAAAVSPVDRR